MLRIVSQTGERYRYDPEDLGFESECISTVFKFGRDIVGIYYEDFDFNDDPTGYKTVLLAHYDDQLLAQTSLEDFNDWKERFTEEEPVYHFMSIEECNLVLSHLTSGTEWLFRKVS